MRLDQVLGHQAIKDRLGLAVRQDHLPSAYLFFGPDGVGKKTLVKALAQGLNCTSGDSCGSCENCRLLLRGEHPDFLHLAPQGQNLRIAQIQGLIEQLNLKPGLAKKRVVLVQDAHRLNQESANCFLKILEEPPLDSLIILTTTDENLLLETILSRCQKVPFYPLEPGELAQLLAERHHLSPSQLDLALAYAQGCYRPDFLEKLPQLLELRQQVLEFLCNQDGASMVLHLQRLEGVLKQEQEGFYLEFLSACLRDMACLHQGLGLPLLNPDLSGPLANLAFQTSPEAISGAFDLVIETEKALGLFAGKQTALEALLVQIRQVFRGALVI